MVTVSLFTQGIQSNFEEKIMTKYVIDCQRMVGLEGFFGVVWIFFWIMLVSFIPCPSENMCDIYGYMDDPISGIREIFHSPPILLWSCVIVFSILFIFSPAPYFLSIIFILQHFHSIISL